MAVANDTTKLKGWGVRVEWACRTCGKTTKSKPCVAAKAIYCSRSCAARSESRCSRPKVACPCCGVTFRSGMTGGQRQIHCSAACEGAERRRKNAERKLADASDPWLPIKKIAAICAASRVAPINLGRVIKAAAVANNKALIVARKARRLSACKCSLCGAGITPGVCRPKKHCAKCAAKKARNTESAKRRKRKAKSSRRARVRGLKHQAIDPLLVFQRDRWRCKLCGIKTPKAKRGSIDPDAPELDHIIPLAIGGGHTWGNVQCACRKCNAAKGATALGQIGFDFAA